MSCRRTASWTAPATLTIDESALTGESLPVMRSATGDRVLLAGTTVLSGRGAMTVTATGRHTQYGTIGRLVASVRSPRTPLQKFVRSLVLRFGLVAVVFCTAVIGLELARGKGWGAAIIAGVSLAIAAVPEEFSMGTIPGSESAA